MCNSSIDSLLVRTIRTIAMILFLVTAFSGRLLAAETVEVRIAGLEGDSLKNVQAALVLPSGLVKDGAVNKPWLEHFSHQAESRVREALEPFGYYGSKVTTLLEEKTPDGYVLLVTVTEGEPTRLTEVEVKLQGPGDSEALLLEKVTTFPLRTGDQLHHEIYEKAKGEILVAARELGYLDAVFSLHTIQVDPSSRSARIHLVMASGPRYLFGGTTIEGTTYYPQELLRRFISFSPGDPFSYKALGETQLNFAGSAYFKSVKIIPDKEAASGFRVPVVVSVVPAARRIIRPGIGYGTDTGLRGSVGYKDLSLFYPGNILDTEITVAQKLQGLGVAYSIPSRKNLQSVTTLQLNLQREFVNDALSKIAALEIDRTVGFGDNYLGTAFIRLQYEEYNVGLDDSISILLLPGLRLSRRMYDDLIHPTKGYHYMLETRGTLREIGSDAEFVQFIAEGGGIIPLPWDLSLHGRSKVGGTLIKTPFSDMPTSLRFFAGGDNSVRGYAYKSLGPKDASGEVTGGRNLLQGSIELEKAFTKRWGISIFYDAGNAFNTFQEFRVYQGAGIGYHYYTPIGTLNFGLARQIGIPDPKFRIHFTIGFQL